MRLLAALTLAALLGGCIVASPPQENWQRQMDPRVVDSPRALYHLAKSRDERDRANELEELVREQRKRLVEINNHKQETSVAAMRKECFGREPKHLKAVEVRLLNGEADGLTQVVENQKQVVDLIEARISQCDRRSRAQLLEMDAALRNPLVVEGPKVED